MCRNPDHSNRQHKLSSAGTISQRSPFSITPYMPQFGCRRHGGCQFLRSNPMENIHADVIDSLNWTEQGIRAIKDGAKRAKAAREWLKSLDLKSKRFI